MQRTIGLPIAHRSERSRFPLKKVLPLVLLVGLLLIGFAVLNPRNPAYNPEDRADLDTQAQSIRATGNFTQAQRWRDLIKSGSTECYYKPGPPQEYIVAGILPDAYIQPQTGAIHWYVRFPANLQPTLFGPPEVELGVQTMQVFYGMIKADGFSACSTLQSKRASGVLGF